MEIISLRENLSREPDFAGNLPSHLRPDWDIYFLGICFAVSERGDCTRSKVGAVVVDPGHRIVSTGYVGAPAGEPGCLEGACPRGKHYPLSGEESFGSLFCACGSRWPCSRSAEPGKGSYEDCISLHAELNAVIYAGRDRCLGGTIYVTREPCSWCRKVITAAGIERVVIP